MHEGLVFVNVSHPDELRDKNTQRVVRRRVMREIGRSRRRPTRPPAVTFEWQPKCPTPTPSLDWMPVKMDLRARQLVHFMNAEATYNYRPFRGIWFSMALRDDSAFTLSLANASMFLEEARHPDTFRYETCEETLVYYGRCVRQITSRLSNPSDCTSEGVITTILGLICHDLYVGTLDRWAHHIKGLFRIADLRGGFHDLSDELQLFACWFDVLGSVAQDSPPRLPKYLGPPGNLPAPASTQQRHLQSILEELESAPASLSALIPVILKMSAVADFVNANFHQPGFWRTEDDLSSLRLFGPITHELLKMPRYDYTNSSSFEFVREMTRLSLLIVLAGLKTRYGFSAVETVALQEKFQRHIQHTSIDRSSLPFKSLEIWALMATAMLQPTGPVRRTYVQDISHQMGSMDIANGASIVEFACGFLWIEVFAQDFDDLMQEISF